MFHLQIFTWNISILFNTQYTAMRYSIMLQLVTGITLVLVGGAAIFAWIQNRPNPPQQGASLTEQTK
ncbi:hypothetical protein DSM106972_037040 [Dulcicalothrix desertica PCC 7102]|uniref:Uncharacterized protein n=1 Tax=Dulcicalothrix desertica PCC 7102 TaxID=232991 RepID=A0A433VHX3_9CYAN|nr:hypothetical protein DSM106972_037040 [Dulcicalothrix desertica PCC 7102]